MLNVTLGLLSYFIVYWILKDHLPYDPASKNIKPSQPVEYVVMRNMIIFFITGPIIWYMFPDCSEYFPSSAFLRFLLCIIFADISFYFTHRLMHTKFFYRWHKQHHQFNIAYPIVALYASPVEAIICDALSVGLGPALLKLTVLELQAWMIFMAVHSLILHSSLNYGGDHVVHHKKFGYNYGLFCIVDHVMGTYRS